MRVCFSDFEYALIRSSWNSLLRGVSFKLTDISSAEKERRDELLDVLVKIFISGFDILEFFDYGIAHLSFKL